MEELNMVCFRFILLITGITLSRGDNVKRAGCVDTIPNCVDYTSGICSDPLYDGWVKERCAKFCNKCNIVTTTVAPTAPNPNGCNDKLPNCVDYGTGICSDANYAHWVKENCPRHCRQCPDSAPLTTPGTYPTVCEDKISVCAGYTKAVCTDPQYDGWMMKNCALFCNRCGPNAITTTPKPMTVSPLGSCHDALTNCAAYGASVCVDPLYTTWVQENCMSFCKKCDSGSTVCQDNVNNCAELQQNGNICTDAGASVYAHQNCRKTCGICHGGALIPDTCTDALPNCADYDANVCQDTNYYQWVKQNCAKTCNQCSHNVLTTQPPSLHVSDGCVYKGHVYQEGNTWDDGCDYICTCQDGPTGKYVCTQMCLSWNLPKECHLVAAAPGKCCATPSCPPGFHIDYPPNYVEH